MRYDLAIMGDPADAKTALRIDNTANAGIYKLMQRVMVLLFTDSTSPYNLGNGTLLLSQIRGANIGSDMGQLQNQFNIAAAAVLETIQSAESTNDPDDERLAEIRINVNAGGTADSIDATAVVRSLAGDSITVRVPISNLALETT